MSIRRALLNHASRLPQHPKSRALSFCTASLRSSVAIGISSRESNANVGRIQNDPNGETATEKTQETGTVPEADIRVAEPLNARWSCPGLGDGGSVPRSAGSSTFGASKGNSPVSPLQSRFESNLSSERPSLEIHGEQKDTSVPSAVITDWHGAGSLSDLDNRQKEGQAGQTDHGTIKQIGPDEPIPVDRKGFVKLMRLMPHGLVIVFAGNRDERSDSVPWQGEEGMLVSSFASVTVYPKPFVSFNVKLPSSTYDKITKTGVFTVVSVNNAMIADAFTKHTPARKVLHEKLMNKTVDRSLGAQGVVWWMRCTVMGGKAISVGDHVIVVGEVVDLGTCDGLDRGRALVYFDGNYRLLGEEVRPHDDAPMVRDLLPASRKDIE